MSDPSPTCGVSPTGAPTRRRFTATAGAILALGVSLPPWRLLAAAAPGQDLAADLARIEADNGGRLGVSVHDTATGLRVGHRANERFPLCSTFKLLACGAVLARVDAGQDDLGRRIRFEASDLVPYSPVTQGRVGRDGMLLGEICVAAITRSDNTAGNLILASLGGPPAVTAFARSLGDPVTRLDRTETSLDAAIPGDPRDTTTPDAMASTLQALVLGTRLSAGSRDQLTTWLIGSQTGGAKLRAGVPATWRVGDKTGAGDFGTNNDVAVLWSPDRKPLIVCVYLTETKASFETCNATIASVGRAVARWIAA